jgi:hypothetical protein
MHHHECHRDVAIPHIPLPFKEVMPYVLKVKPREKKAKAAKKSKA